MSKDKAIEWIERAQDKIIVTRDLIEGYNGGNVYLKMAMENLNKAMEELNDPNG